MGWGRFGEGMNTDQEAEQSTNPKEWSIADTLSMSVEEFHIHQITQNGSQASYEETRPCGHPHTVERHRKSFT